MRKLLFFLLALAACDDGFIHVQERNAVPVITIVGFKEGEAKITKKAKFYKGKGARFEFEVKSDDINKNLQGFLFIPLSGEERLKITRQGKVIKKGVFYPFDKGEAVEEKLLFEMSAVGKAALEVQVKDSFGKAAQVTFNLEAVSNGKPVAQLEVYEGGQGGYVLDGRASYDGDADLGGMITGYRFTFDNRIITTTKARLGISLTQPGTYTVKLTVIDNEGMESEEVTNDVTIE